MNHLIRGALALAVAGMAGSAALAYPGYSSLDYHIKLTKDTGGLDIAVSTFTGPAVTIGLQNKSDSAALCSASFSKIEDAGNGDNTRSVTVKPGKKATLAYPAARLGGEFSTAFVNLKCEKS